MDHIQYAKNVLDPFVKEDLKSLLTRHIREVPHYNFMYKGEPPTNFIEKIIRQLIGQTHHVEYWVRNQLEHCLWHVDGNELEQKRDYIRYRGYDPDQNIEFPLNTHVLYVNIHPKMEGGKLLLCPYNTYVEGRGILDDSYQPLEGSRIMEIKPVENHMVIWDKPIYHAVGKVENLDVVEYRLSLMFSAWDKIPSMYNQHRHWTTYDTINWQEPQPMEFNLTL
jgi:hypothetical protein